MRGANGACGHQGGAGAGAAGDAMDAGGFQGRVIAERMVVLRRPSW